MSAPAAVEELFTNVAERLLVEDAALERGRMFGSVALKVGGKVFALYAQGAIVVKVPAAQVAELVSAGAGRPFDPGHGRVMKEWVSCTPIDEAACEALMREARSFVAEGMRAYG